VLAAVWRRIGGAPPEERGPMTPGEAVDDMAVG